VVEVGKLRVAYREGLRVAPTWNPGKNGQGQTVPDKESREGEEGKVRRYVAGKSETTTSD
jgi:hypothetical protein